MTSNDEHPLALKVIESQRKNAWRWWACAECDTVARSEPRLYEHALECHQEVIKDKAQGGPIWKNYLQNSLKEQRPVRRDIEPLEGASGKQSPDSMVPMVEDDSLQQLSTRSPSAPIPSGPFEGLSITGDPSQQPADRSTLINPLKRPSTQSSSQAHAGHPTNRPSPRGRRPKTASGSNQLDPNFDTARHVTGSKRLFDPLSDRTSFGKTKPTAPHEVSSPRRHDYSKGASDKAAYNSNRESMRENVGSEGPLSPEKADSLDDEDELVDSEPEILLQPETKPISHEQLVAEVKGIYAGLVMVEAKCIDVDEKQSIAAKERDPSKQTKLTLEQYSALIALHKTLLHEHHDFFLASQHPAASPALRKLAEKYQMPARMWRHGIHAFLEVLRYRLPESLDHMLAFIIIAYSMMALLYETVETFQDTWVECLGDLGRYRMAIEDEDIRDREVWSGVAKHWYEKAADRNPKVGRLYHHLAILAKPYTIHQLSLYCRSLTCIIPFESAQGSIMTMLRPVLENRDSVYQRSNTMEVTFIRAHALLFTGGPNDEYRKLVHQLIAGELLSKYISRAGPKFKDIGVYAALCNIAALYGYSTAVDGSSTPSVLMLYFEVGRRNISQQSKDKRTPETSPEPIPKVENLSVKDQQESTNKTRIASSIAFETLAVALRRSKDKNVYLLIHFYAVFIWAMAPIKKAMQLIERSIPWTDIVNFLNSVVDRSKITERIRSSKFPGRTTGNKPRPLLEDYAMRGLPHAKSYFPPKWFDDAGIDLEERSLDLPSFFAPRLDRILWAFFQVSTLQQWIIFDEQACIFIETSYIATLPPWELVQPLEHRAKVDIPMGNTEGTEEASASPIGTSLDDDDQSTCKRSQSFQEDLKRERRSFTSPKVILKRETPHDTEMKDLIASKLDTSVPKVEEVNQATEEWFQAGEQKHEFVDRKVVKAEPTDSHKLFQVFDETKDPTII